MPAAITQEVSVAAQYASRKQQLQQQQKQIVQILTAQQARLQHHPLPAVKMHSAGGGPAWHQEVPLQPVVLFGALEQLQGLALAYLQPRDVVRAAAGSNSSSRSSSAQFMSKANGHHAKAPPGAANGCSSSSAQQQQHSPAADPVSSDIGDSDTEDASAANPAAASTQHSSSVALMLVLRKVQELLQLLRNFREANVAINAAAEADPCDAAVAARPSLVATDAWGVAAPDLFSAASLLLYRFPEPCGHGVWAPAVAAAASAGSEEMQATRSSDGNGSWSDAGASSSNACSSSSSDEPDWFDCMSLTALAGAGDLAWRAHALLAGLQEIGQAGSSSLQEVLAEAVLGTLQALQHYHQRTLALQQMREHRAVPQDLQDVQRVCQQHHLQLPPEALQQLQYVPELVL
jgi:hypothetical protein